MYNSHKYYIEPQKAIKILEAERKRKKIAYIGNDSQGNRIYQIYWKSIALCGTDGGLGAKMGIYALPCLVPDKIKKRQNGRRFKPPFSKAHTLIAQDKHGVFVDNNIRKLTPIECERLQTVPDQYTDVGIADAQRYKMLGNGWTIDVIAHIFKGIQ